MRLTFILIILHLALATLNSTADERIRTSAGQIPQVIARDSDGSAKSPAASSYQASASLFKGPVTTPQKPFIRLSAPHESRVAVLAVSSKSVF